MNKTTSSRRDFFKKGLLAVATTMPLTVEAAPPDEKVKMLTPDGKLVEVNKSTLSKATKKKVSNKEILDWREAKG